MSQQGPIYWTFKMGTWDEGQEENLQAPTLEPEEKGKVWVSESGVKFSVTGLQPF